MLARSHGSERCFETVRSREELSHDCDQEDLAASDKKKVAEDAARRDEEDRAASKEQEKSS